MSKNRWVPLRRATPKGPWPERTIAIAMDKWKKTREEVLALLDAEQEREEIWRNDIYQVVRRVWENGWVQLNIRRIDGKPIFRDWRHFQRIKDELVGPDCEGVELYPAQERLVDTSNKYHIWCCPDPSWRFPFGFTERDVMDSDERDVPGTRQRKLTMG